MVKKPMKGEQIDIKDVGKLTYPLAASPKLDGIRCYHKDGKALTTSFKDLPNAWTNKHISAIPIQNLDGECLVKGGFSDVQSAFMSEYGEPDFEYWVFDYVKDGNLEIPYMTRMEMLGALALPKFCKKVLPVICNTKEELEAFVEQCLLQGFEGVMVRSLLGPYKCGKATVKQGWLLKIKPMEDSEAQVIGFEEQMHNENEAELDNFGRTKRSKAQEGMVPANTLGKFVVIQTGDTPWKGQEFRIGTGKGLTQVLRKDIWDNQSKYMGKVITYCYQEIGTKDLPRLPIYKGFRDKRDISE